MRHKMFVWVWNGRLIVFLNVRWNFAFQKKQGISLSINRKGQLTCDSATSLSNFKQSIADFVSISKQFLSFDNGLPNQCSVDRTKYSLYNLFI